MKRVSFVTVYVIGSSDMWDYYVRYEGNLSDYTVKLILVKPSPYGDNFDKDKILEVIK
jgi:hypothetical protein